MPKLQRVDYWDSCVFIAYLNNEPERASTIDQLLVEVNAVSDKRIATSALTAIEVTHVAHERVSGELDPVAEGEIDALLNSSALVTIEAHPHIIAQARRLIRQAVARKRKLTPIDAVHLATAMWLRENGIEVENFFTYDGLDRFSEMIGLRIREPVVEQLRLALEDARVEDERTALESDSAG